VSEYPEHDKLTAVNDKTAAIHDFVEWMMSTYHARFMTYRDTEDFEGWTEPDRYFDVWLAEWADIDMRKIEDEKRAMLAKQRELNERG